MIERIGCDSILTNPGLGRAMAKYKPCDYSQRVMVPVSLEEHLVPGTLEFAIQTLVEDRIDMVVFEGRYQNDEELLRRQVEADQGEGEDDDVGGPTGGGNRTKQVERLRRKAERIREFFEVA